jgi:hypothetical protein
LFLVHFVLIALLFFHVQVINLRSMNPLDALLIVRGASSAECIS